MEKLYHEFLSYKYGNLTWVIATYGYFEIMSENNSDVIAHIGINPANGGLSVHTSHRDSLSSWFNLDSKLFSEWIIKRYIFKYYDVSHSDELRDKLLNNETPPLV